MRIGYQSDAGAEPGTGNDPQIVVVSRDRPHSEIAKELRPSAARYCEVTNKASACQAEDNARRDARLQTITPAIRHSCAIHPATCLPDLRFVVAAHLGGYPACQKVVANFEAIGGKFLSEIEPEMLSSDALDRALPGWSWMNAKQFWDQGDRRMPTLMVLRFQRVLSDCGIGPWRSVGPGVKLSRIAVPYAPEAKHVILLKVKPNKRMPAHGHSGLEVTQSAEGHNRSFLDGGNCYLPGDFVEGDDKRRTTARSSDRRAKAFSLGGHRGAEVQFRSILGRLLQPLVRICRPLMGSPDELLGVIRLERSTKAPANAVVMANHENGRIRRSPGGRVEAARVHHLDE